MTSPLIPAITFRALLQGLDTLHVDTDQILATVGLTRGKLADPFLGLPEEMFDQIWKSAFTQVPLPDLPTRAGFAVPRGSFGLLDHLVESADTFGHGMQALNIFFWLVSTGIHFEFEHTRDDVMWLVQEPPEGGLKVTTQWTLAVCANRLRQCMGKNVVSHVFLSYDGPDIIDALREHYDAEVTVGHRRDGLQFVRGCWNQPMPYANPSLSESLRAAADQLEIQQFEASPLIYAIRTCLPDLLQDGDFSLSQVAERLGVSSRTLQRQLAGENTTFRELLDGYRHDRAIELLHQQQLNIVTIAYELGYSEQSSFNRAFRRWTGKTPSEWASQS